MRCLPRFEHDLRIRFEFSDVVLISASHHVVQILNVVQTEVVSCDTNSIRLRS